MNRCRGTKRNGEPCTLPAKGTDGYCWAHAPENAEQRRRAASRAGRAKPNQEVRTLKEQIKTAISAVEDGSLNRNNARVMFQGWAVLLDYIRLEREVRVEEELSARIGELEDAGRDAS